MYSEWAGDEIRIEKLEIYAYHGVYPEERKGGQLFLVSVVLYTDTRRAGMEDNIEYSTDYGNVSLFIEQWMKKNTCHTLEAVAERLAEEILLKYDLICSLDLEIYKPEAPIPLSFHSVSVKIHRSWHKAYLSVGSNMGDRQNLIETGIRALTEHPRIRPVRVSEIIETEPYGGVEQGNFLNGVIEIDTLLGPEELLEALHRIENNAGRERTVHWGPRTLDLDILFYDKLVYESADLVIPHPDMQNREFVLKPLSTVAPNYRHPVLGTTVLQELAELEESSRLL
ncbi:MAG: 2-amino-4-hydroxy-6-hydroxymethyldihydropteridine diphosphokinase [Butyrivibrio sp.]|nr:2-amino-4-hydroxy-6-hydroxymethyldihydropteridine diphosphokinase [Acetatifactor muris]MCM1559987.1 2-amino-4-hydroxy-6-hydroxymethyldihydropteridine diphosphokinase [Butyrivibrio sp.]